MEELSLDDAVEVLGELFKLTEVHLWDDGSSVGEAIGVQEPIKFMACEKSPSSIISGLDSLPEDLEVAETMSILGLPLSFRTNKEKRNGSMSGKRKGRKMNSNPQCLVEIDEIPLNLGEKASLFEVPKNGTLSDLDALSNLSLERVDSTNSTSTITEELDHAKENNEDGECVNNNEGETVISLETEVQSIASHGTSIHKSGEWTSYWDDHYMKLYYCNVRTEESTWDPPPVMEEIVAGEVETFCDDVSGAPQFVEVHGNTQYGEGEGSSNNSLKTPPVMEEIVAGEVEPFCDDVSGAPQFIEVHGNTQYGEGEGSSNNSLKRKKRGKRSISAQGVLRQVTPAISKYWSQRYLLFSRFDRGIRMDEEGWFSVTPETLSKHHAVRCGGGVVVDFFAGVGGNAIQFARRSKHVIAIDIDPNKIDYARHNAAIYGVNESIDFVVGDSFSLASALKADTVFMSPPWGGPDYSKVKKFDMATMLKPHDGKHLFDVGRRIASKVVMFLPRNVDVEQLAEISSSATPPWSLEVEKNYMNGRLKAITAYFSEPSL